MGVGLYVYFFIGYGEVIWDGIVYIGKLFFNCFIFMFLYEFENDFGGFSLNGEMNFMVNFNDEKFFVVFNFFWYVKWSVLVLYGECFMGFFCLKWG